MPGITGILAKELEVKWRDALYDHARMLFDGKHLFSHDETHHARVWNFCKEVANELAGNNLSLTPAEIETLLIASFFHDTGLTIDPGFLHGQESARLCTGYFRDFAEPPKHLDIILDVIKRHDLKETVSPLSKNGRENLELASLFSVCDDMDAFGVVGAYRYIEIYLFRGIKPDLLPGEVIPNMEKRHHRFATLFDSYPGFIKRHTRRYREGRNFFKDLEFQIQQVGYSADNFIGPVGVINLIKENVMENGTPPGLFCERVPSMGLDSYLTHFFSRLSRGLSKAIPTGQHAGLAHVKVKS